MEASAFEAVGEVELGAFDVEETLEVHHHAAAVDVGDAVLRLEGGVPAEVVGQAGAAAGYHGHAKHRFGEVDALLGCRLTELIDGAVCDLYIHNKYWLWATGFGL